jgi:hypothetical protein
MANWSAGKEYEQPPEGTTLGRCIRIIDIGTQHGEWQGKPTSRRQCIIVWELPNDLMADGDFAGYPFTVSEFYTQSIGPKASLGKMLVSWRGKEFTKEELDAFNPRAILDKPCTLSLYRNDKGRTKIGSVSPVMRGTQVPSRVNELVYFMLDEFDAAVYDGLSSGIKDLIAKSDEWKERVDASAPKANPDTAPNLTQGQRAAAASKAAAFDDGAPFDDAIPF